MLQTVTLSPLENMTDTTQALEETNYNLTENETLSDSGHNNTSLGIERSELPLSVFEIFIVIEIVMVVLELLLSIGAAVKMKQWRRNYRNQMLTQISLVRFLKRVIGYIIFLEKNRAIPTQQEPSLLNLCSIIYFNFVTIFLVFFLIKHMYDTLIVVFVKVTKNSLYKVTIFAWLFPIVLTGLWIAFISYNVMDKWLVDLIFCSLFKWTFTVIGTILYICILHRIIEDKFRKFAASLAIITFMLCLTINMYTITSDISRLFRCYSLIVMKYIFGFVLNCLVLCLYVALISSNFSHRIKHCDNMSNHSVNAVNRESQPEIEQRYVKYDSQMMLEINMK